jgi:hypothetical protein
VNFQYFNTMRTCFLIITALIFWGCPAPTSTTDTEPPVGELQFTYLQNDQILYFAIDVATSHKNSPLATAALEWWGTDTIDTPEVDPDYLLLKDDGTNGDIIENDDLYSLKVINDSLTLMNPISSSDTGRVYVEFQATYGNNEPITVEDSFYLGNIIPRIDSITAPDTIVRPSDNSIIFEPVEAKVRDSNGLDDIRRVGFVSYHVEGDSFLNEGNIINLYDDGGEVIIWEPNFTSGDATPDDGVYSFRVPVFGTGPENEDLGLITKAGTFDWIFEAMDMANTYSDTVIHRIIVQ